MFVRLDIIENNRYLLDKVINLDVTSILLVKNKARCRIVGRFHGLKGDGILATSRHMIALPCQSYS